MKSLIAEDNFTNRVLLQEILRPYGPAHVAVNGREALMAIKEAHQSGAPYDLICLDIVMPEMDGRSALRAIREFEEERQVPSANHAKIVMTTMLGDGASVVTSFKESCDAYIVKPIDRGKLLEHLRHWGLIP